MFESGTTYGIRRPSSLVYVDEIPALDGSNAVVSWGATHVDVVLVETLKSILNARVPVERNCALVAYHDLQSYLRTKVFTEVETGGSLSAHNRGKMCIPGWYPGPTHLINLRRDVRTIPLRQLPEIYSWVRGAVCIDSRELFGNILYDVCWKKLQVHPKLCRLAQIAKEIVEEDADCSLTLSPRIEIILDTVGSHWGEVEDGLEERETMEAASLLARTGNKL